MPRDHLFGEVDRLELLERRIREDGAVLPGGILKVDSFLNHQMDINLFDQMGEEFKRRFADKPINKIVTIEASGIGIACIVATTIGRVGIASGFGCSCRKNP